MAGIHGTLSNHGIAIGYNEHDVDEEGTRVGFTLTEWPLEHVYWDASREALFTYQKTGAPIEVTHGNGRWTVFRKVRDEPWTHDAAIIPAAFVWAAHANGLSDWAAATLAHGQAKIVGEMPENVALQTSDGLTPEAEAFLQLLQDLVSGSIGVGLRPHGSKTEFIANGSNAWQVFNELILNREKAAARIYLGTDAILGSVGNAPGVDISALFAVASLILQGDLEAIQDALTTGVYEPWAAINDGDSRYAPKFEYQVPDPDASKKATERQEKRDALLATIKEMRAQGMTVDQETVNKLAAEYGVDDPPQLASGEKKVVPLALAPTDIARVVRVREARAAQGLPPLGDVRDDLFIAELEAKTEASAEIKVDNATEPKPAPAPNAAPGPQ